MGKSKNIIHYLTQSHPEFYELLEVLCQGELINQLRLSGTLLLPDNKLLEELTNMANDHDSEDQASRLLNALVSQLVLTTTGDFNTHRDNIPNLLEQRILVKYVRGDRVELTCGAILTPLNDFTLYKQSIGKFMVWNLSESLIPTDGPEAVKFDPETLGKSTKPVVNHQSRSMRTNIARKVETSYMQERINFNNSPSYDDAGNRMRSRDPYLETVMSLVHYIIKQGCYENILYEKVLPMISYDKSDFYLLVEPYKESNNYLLPDKLIYDWYNSRMKVPNVGNIMNQIDTLYTKKQKYTDCLLYCNLEGAMKQVENGRQQFRKKKVGPNNIVSALEGLYGAYFKANILPTKLIEYYGEPKYKLYEDEFRYQIFQWFDRFEYNHEFDRNLFNRIMGVIRDYTQSDRIKPYMLRPFERDLSSLEKTNDISIFMCSSHLFYLPITNNILNNYPHSHSLQKPRTVSNKIYNITMVLRKKSGHYIHGGRDPNEEDEVKGLFKQLCKQHGTKKARELLNQILSQSNDDSNGIQNGSTKTNQ